MESTTSNKPRNIKYHNQKLILSMLRQAEMLSIADIAQTAALSKTTVTKVMNEFAAKGLAVAVGKGASTELGGKKPEQFAFNARHSHVVVLAVSHDRIIGALSDLKCNLLYRRSVDCGVHVNYRSAVRIMAETVLGLMDDAGIGPDGICAVVLGCEGVVDADSRVIHYTTYHSWGRSLPIGDDLAVLLPFPVRLHVDNNVRLAGYAHLILNPDQYGGIAVVSSHHSAGGCIIEGRRLVRGANSFVGEFGHMILDPYSDVRCSCGDYGCFGALVSPDLVLAHAHRTYVEHSNSILYARTRDGVLDVDAIFAAADAGDAFAQVLLDRVIRCFAILIHNIVLLRDPAKVIIQGVYAAAGGYFLDTLRERVRSFPFYKMKRDLSVTYSPISGLDSYLVGAAYYAVDMYLNGNQLYD